VGSIGGRNLTGEIAHETVPENETSFVNLSANLSRSYLTYPNQKKDRYVGRVYLTVESIFTARLISQQILSTNQKIVAFIRNLWRVVLRSLSGPI
jgi:hypothetical protein